MIIKISGLRDVTKDCVARSVLFEVQVYSISFNYYLCYLYITVC